MDLILKLRKGMLQIKNSLKNLLLKSGSQIVGNSVCTSKLYATAPNFLLYILNMFAK